MNPYEEMRRFYINKFHEQGESIIPVLCNISVAKTVFLDAYKRLPPIEQMPEQEKKEMKQYIVNLFPDKSIQEKLECCKIVYTLGNLI